jgi:hypothetical protein
MAVQLVCDGCHHLLKPEKAKTLGDLDPVAFCPGCVAQWEATEGVIAAARVAAIEMFQTARAAALADVRPQLKKLPDDPGEGV